VDGLCGTSCPASNSWQGFFESSAADPVLDYGLATSTPTCTNTAAGKNGNRTRFADVKDGTPVTDVSYWGADRCRW